MKMQRIITRRSAVGMVLAGAAAFVGAPVQAQLIGGDLLVSYSEYQGTASTVTVGQALPGGGTAVANGANLSVFNNETPDASFGITSSILIDQFNTSSNSVDNTINVTALAAQQGINLTTSFSSKSELALNTSTDGSAITFMGYNAAANTLDVSNSNTPGLTDPTNPVTSATSRDVAQLNLNGSLEVTQTNAYSGNNGRAAILANGDYYMVGNAGNSGSGTSNSTLNSLSANTGVQYIAAGSSNPNSTVVGAHQGGTGSTGDQYGFSVTQVGDTADKTGKDNNYRGETVFNGTLYVTKGSGSNGINTVYQVGPVGGVNNLAANASTTTISVLPGFSTALAKTATNGPNPFGLFFANASTLYVADEGAGGTLSSAASDTFAGLEKWVNSKADGTGTWSLAYTLTSGLNIGQSYTVNGTGAYAGQSVTTGVDGLRNLAGKVNADGTVTLYAVTSTTGSSITDSGADPNALVELTDTLGDTTLSQASGETFSTLEQASYGEVLRGVDLAPIPEPSTYALYAGVAMLGYVLARRKLAAA